MKRDARATRARILAAATSEFAAHGIAGARVDRIAASAEANKNMIYIYFGNKEQLFGAVFSDGIQQLLETVPIDADDLPSYAGALFDHIERHPELSRLARWQGLERGDAVASFDTTVAATMTKIQAVAASQAAGQVNDRLTPDQLLSMLLNLAATWSDGAPELASVEVTDAMRASRRAAIVWAIGRLTTPDRSAAGRRPSDRPVAERHTT